jgi:phage terminase small subunit
MYSLKGHISEEERFLIEADTSSATNMEMAICHAYNVMYGNLSDEDAIKTAGIGGKYDKYKDLLPTGVKVAEASGGKWGGSLIHSGSGSAASNNYQNATDTTPKADFTGDSDNYISLKKAGVSGKGAQLMSAKSAEAAGVVNAAIQHYQKNTKDAVVTGVSEALHILQEEMLATARNDMQVVVGGGKTDFANWYMTKSSRVNDLKKVERNVKKVTAHLKAELGIMGIPRAGRNLEKNLIQNDKIKKVETIKDLEPYEQEYRDDQSWSVGGKKGVMVNPAHVAKGTELDDTGLKTQITDVVNVSIESKAWKSQLEEFFSNNKDLKKWIVYEAGSGLYKFTGNLSNDSKYTGSTKAVANKIVVFKDSGIKEQYDMLDFADNNTSLVDKVDISYKGSKTSRYIKLGLAAQYESELPMLQEEITRLQAQYMLNEGVFRWIKDKSAVLAQKVKDVVKVFYEKIIKKLIAWLIEKAKQGVSLLFEAMGIETTVTMSTPKW